MNCPPVVYEGSISLHGGSSTFSGLDAAGHGENGGFVFPGRGPNGKYYGSHPFDNPNGSDVTCAEWDNRCNLDECLMREKNKYPWHSHYQAVGGPNSNTFAYLIAKNCGITSFPEENTWLGHHGMGAKPAASWEDRPGNPASEYTKLPGDGGG